MLFVCLFMSWAMGCPLFPYLKERMTHSGVSLHSYGQGEVDGAGESYLGHGEQDRHQVLVQAGRSNTKQVHGLKYTLYSKDDFCYPFVRAIFYLSTDSLPLKHVRDAKDDNTSNDVEEITKGQDTHKLVEIVFLVDEPKDQTDISYNSKQSNKYLQA